MHGRLRGGCGSCGWLVIASGLHSRDEVQAQIADVLRTSDATSRVLLNKFLVTKPSEMTGNQNEGKSPLVPTSAKASLYFDYFRFKLDRVGEETLRDGSCFEMRGWVKCDVAWTSCREMEPTIPSQAWPPSSAVCGPPGHPSRHRDGPARNLLAARRVAVTCHKRRELDKLPCKLGNATQ